jgi:hypothetical protein
MKVVFKITVDREDRNFDEEKKKLNKLMTQVAKRISIEKRGLKGEGYYYIYYTNPLNKKNGRGNTFIWDFEIKQSFVELKFEYIGKRSSLFRIGNILSEVEWDWEQSNEKKAVLTFVPYPNPNLNSSQFQRASVQLYLYEYHTSTPPFWSMKWYEELKPCYSYDETEDGEEDGYYTPYNLDQLPVIGSEDGSEDIRNDTEKCAVIYDHLHHRPRAVVLYNNIYAENPPWWVEQQHY